MTSYFYTYDACIHNEVLKKYVNLLSFLEFGICKYAESFAVLFRVEFDSGCAVWDTTARGFLSSSGSLALLRLKRVLRLLTDLGLTLERRAEGRSQKDVSKDPAG